VDDVDVRDVRRFEKGLITFLTNTKPGLLTGLRDQKTLSPEIKEQLHAALKEYKERLKAEARN